MTMVSTSEVQAPHATKNSSEFSVIIQPVLSGIAALADYVATRSRQKTDRQAFDTMLTLEEYILKDIGVTRGDVVWASKLPLSRNAALELDIIARHNKRVI